MNKKTVITKNPEIGICLHCKVEKKEQANIETCKKCCMFNKCKIINPPE